MLGFYFFLLGIVLYVAVPAGIIYLIVKLASHASNKNKGVPGVTHTTSITRDISLAFLLLSGFFIGLVSIYYMPTQLFGFTTKPAIFVTQVIAGIIVLLVGLALNGILRNFLLAISIVTLLAASPYVFESFGSAAALIALFIAMVVLVVVTIRLSRHGSIRGAKHE